MRKRSWKLGNVKSLALKEGDQVVVGLDVHKRTVYAAVRCNGQELTTWVMPMRAKTVVASLEPMKVALKMILYEAGPTGYGLARALRKAGLPAQVVAPGKTPQPAYRGSKTDRLDCRKLAEYAEKGLLKCITIPTELEEADRQVVRLRDPLVVKLRQAQQQIKSLLLQQAIAEPAGPAHWTHESVEALKQERLSDQIRLALDVPVEDLEPLMALKQRVEAHLSGRMKQKRHREDSRRLRSHPGVGPLTAGTFVTEVYPPKRFARPKEITSYVGLAPRVRQSGETRREGPLVKAGRGALRALLIEASWTWIRHDRHAAAVYRRLVGNTGSPQKAIVAMARRMAVNLWCMLCRGEDYRATA